MARIGIVGGRGFIGRAVAELAQSQGHEVFVPRNREKGALLAEMQRQPCDVLIYAAGLTADFRSRPFDTVEAHVGLLSEVLRTCDFNVLVYLSSTRVYVHCEGGREEAAIAVTPTAPEDMFSLSKLTGESLCFNSGRCCRVVRVSNVFGPGDRSTNFISAVLREAAETGRVVLQLSAASAKDYISLSDTAAMIMAIATAGQHRLYNLASGCNTSNAVIADALGAMGVAVGFAPGGRTVSFPPISIERLAAEFGRPRDRLTDALPALLEEFKAAGR